MYDMTCWLERRTWYVSVSDVEVAGLAGPLGEASTQHNIGTIASFIPYLQVHKSAFIRSWTF